MKVIDHIKEAEKNNKTLISFEITPPKRGGDAQNILKIVNDFKKYKPSFIHVTSRAADVNLEETNEGIKAKIKRKRPGTLGICAAIQYGCGIDTVAHLLCRGFTKEETEDFLIDLNFTGIRNIFAVQGDQSIFKKSISPDKGVNKYASGLVKQIIDMNKGVYLENLLDTKPTDFCVGVAGYPEKHYQAPNLQHDIENLKRKVDVGADYVITQMFFDNEKYFRFLDICEKQRINVPIIPGLKPLIKKSQVRSVSGNFYVDIPYELSKKIFNANNEDIMKISQDWTSNQIQGLISKVPAIHFFIYEKQDPEAVSNVLDNLGFKKDT